MYQWLVSKGLKKHFLFLGYNLVFKRQESEGGSSERPSEVPGSKRNLGAYWRSRVNLERPCPEVCSATAEVRSRTLKCPEGWKDIFIHCVSAGVLFRNTLISIIVCERLLVSWKPVPAFLFCSSPSVHTQPLQLAVLIHLLCLPFNLHTHHAAAFLCL